MIIKIVLFFVFIFSTNSLAATAEKIEANISREFRGSIEKLCTNIEEDVTPVNCANNQINLALLAHKQRKSPRYNLTDEEIVAIWGYTDLYFSAINAALKIKKPFFTEIKVYIDVLNSALSKLPDHVGYVFRGAKIRPETPKKHVVGKVVIYPAYTSTSRDFVILEKSFQCAPYRFEYYSYHGKNISDYSTRIYEHEILFKPGTKFRVIAKGDPDKFDGCENTAIKFILVEEE